MFLIKKLLHPLLKAGRLGRFWRSVYKRYRDEMLAEGQVEWPGGPVWGSTIFAGTGINGISNWVAAAALFTAVLIPTIFAPLTGILFQTASQAAMVGVGVAASMAGAGAAPLAGAATSGLGIGALGGLGRGMLGALSEAPQTIGQRAARMMQSMSLGERLLFAAPHALKNVTLVGTTGILTAMGATNAAKSIATVMPLSSHSTVSERVGKINAARETNLQRIWHPDIDS